MKIGNNVFVGLFVCLPLKMCIQEESVGKYYVVLHADCQPNKSGLKWLVTYIYIDMFVWAYVWQEKLCLQNNVSLYRKTEHDFA